MLKHAEYWDHFLDWVHEIQSGWDESDTDAYRKQRATSWFNHARQCSRDLRALKPTMMSWVPHIACYVVTRQIVLLGDPSRRSADACESYGAVVKKVIKHLTCRRRVKSATTSHANGKSMWKQTFTRGYVEQCFRRTCVRSRLLHGEDNFQFRQRADWKIVQTGRVKSRKLPEFKAEIPVAKRVRDMISSEAEMV